MAVARRTFTVGEYYKMAEAGILHEDDRVELIEGEIVNLTPIGSRHLACVKKLNRLFSQRLGDEVIISIQDPLRLSDQSEPEPDVAILKPRQDFYAESPPGPSDTLLVIEVADTSLLYDRNIKMPIYARAGVVEVWLVDLLQRQITTFSNPSPQGYQSVQTKRSGDRLTPTAWPALTLSLDDLLP
ncbi:MAG: Uma2 family endonuclease [Truepera sp.]|nr:Uma2 family endonuclease [Truepera sp.]